jgi:Tfp pilus assembly protein PilN
MSLLTMLAIIWSVLTVILIVLLIYRSTLSMREDDQLFLDQASSHMQQEQTALLQRINRLTIPVRALAAASGLIALVTIAIWVYRGLNNVQ